MSIPNADLRRWVAVLVVCWVSLSGHPYPGLAAEELPSPPPHFHLRLRSRVEAFKGSGRWEEVQFKKEFLGPETALLICDMWDKHWCSGATRRVEALALKMAPVVNAARNRRILIIHAPSDTMEFYKGHPQRQHALQAPRVTPPSGLGLASPPLPIDDSDGGCDTPGDTVHKAWTRQHPAIPMADPDIISDDGLEIYSVIRQRGIKNLFVMGVHTNMCVLNRSFAIKAMTNWGVACVLIRDLTDAMYDPRDRPFVSHEEGTELVIQHIEKYWCPSVESVDILGALRP